MFGNSHTARPVLDLFLKLLKAALWEQPCSCEQVSDGLWQEVWRLAREQAVEGLVFDAIASLPSAQQPSRTFKMRMAADVTALEEHNIRLEKTLRRIAGIYDAHNLKYLLLKGAAAAANYPEPRHRKGGDIDFWLAARDSISAQEALSLDTDPKAQSRHYNSSFEGIIVENHFHLSHGGPARYLEFDRELLSDTIRLPLTPLSVQDYPIACPSPTFNTLFMLDHMAFHLITGLGLRQVCDWARLLYRHKDGIDREAVARIVEQYGFRRIYNVFALLCTDKLGLPEAYLPIAAVRNRQSQKDATYVWKLILEGGNFGQHNSFWNRSTKHEKLPVLLRKAASFAMLLRDRRKFGLISPTLWRETLRLRIQGQF